MQQQRQFSSARSCKYLAVQRTSYQGPLHSEANSNININSSNTAVKSPAAIATSIARGGLGNPQSLNQLPRKHVKRCKPSSSKNTYPNKNEKKNSSNNRSNN